MSKIECDHVKYCEKCDRYYCLSCGCACDPEKNKIPNIVSMVDVYDLFYKLGYMKKLIELCHNYERMNGKSLIGTGFLQELPIMSLNLPQGQVEIYFKAVFK